MAEVKKYELITDDKINLFGRTLFRIKALISFTTVTGKAVNIGDLGGYIEKEDNLSHSGNAWVCGDAKVYGNAKVYGDARVYGDADYICVKGLGSCNRNTTFYKTKDDGVSVACGCFNGTLKEFETKVKDTHKDTKYAKEYLCAVEMVKVHFEL